MLSSTKVTRETQQLSTSASWSSVFSSSPLSTSGRVRRTVRNGSENGHFTTRISFIDRLCDCRISHRKPVTQKYPLSYVLGGALICQQARLYECERSVGEFGVAFPLGAHRLRSLLTTAGLNKTVKSRVAGRRHASPFPAAALMGGASIHQPGRGRCGEEVRRAASGGGAAASIQATAAG